MVATRNAVSLHYTCIPSQELHRLPLRPIACLASTKLQFGPVYRLRITLRKHEAQEKRLLARELQRHLGASSATDYAPSTAASKAAVVVTSG